MRDWSLLKVIFRGHPLLLDEAERLVRDPLLTLRTAGPVGALQLVAVDAIERVSETFFNASAALDRLRDRLETPR